MLTQTDLAATDGMLRRDAPHRRNPAPVGMEGPAWYAPLKMAADYVLATVILLIALPIMLIAAVLVRLTSSGPVFYSQTRLGRRGRPFTIYKIRSMFHECERLTGARWASAQDPRITCVGWYLRKLHIDELPQLLNVLRGEMSLIGPRPERPEFVPQLERAIPHYAARLQVRPGLTGLAQIQLPPDTDLLSVRRKLAYDLYYVKHVTLWMDVRILAGTAFHVVGMPFPLVKRLFFIPCSVVIEKAYRNLPSEARGQPARHHSAAASM